jgi:NitT/TauT family transport system substrate-binding protein
VLLTASAKFRDGNPKSYRAFFDALSEAIDAINNDKRAAAQLYLDVTKDSKSSVDDIVAITSDRDYAFTLQPQKVLKTAQFMAKIGAIKHTPASIDELFFPEIGASKGD